MYQAEALSNSIPPLEVVPNPIFAVNGNATRLRLLGQLTQRYNDGIQQIYQSLKTQEKARESRVYTYDIVGLWRDVSHLPGKVRTDGMQRYTTL